MSIEVRPCGSLEELRDALDADQPLLRLRATREEDAERFAQWLELDRMHAARSTTRIVGGAGAFTFDVSVPGGKCPAAGVTVVGVLPTHRRRGALTAMMRAQLDDARERGDVLAVPLGVRGDDLRRATATGSPRGWGR